MSRSCCTQAAISALCLEASRRPPVDDLSRVSVELKSPARMTLAPCFCQSMASTALTVAMVSGRRAPPWLNGSTSTMQDWRSWVQFPWVTSTSNVDMARIFVFYLAMVRNCCGFLWRRSGGCSCLPFTTSAKAVGWVPLEWTRCTYVLN